MYSNSVFLFSVEKSIQNKKEYESLLPFGEYQIKFCNTTPMMCAYSDGRELLIYGYAVDVRDGKIEMLADKILSVTKTIEDVVDYEMHLGGKYLIFYKDAYGMYAIPDATASIPFCYSTGECQLVCAPNSEFIANKLSILPDEQLLKIRRSSEISQAMPYNLTIYKEIEQLLPNHYFSFCERKAVRFVNLQERASSISAKEAATITAPMIENILRLYSGRFKLYCPITSGRDSRVVLSFMLNDDCKTETYTINHSIFCKDEPDVLIPIQIAQAVNIINEQIRDREPDEQMQKEFDEAFGATGYSKRTLMIANTINHAYADGAVINGDIIGQVGKCSLHRDIPELFASGRYFRCKLHNFSRESLAALRKWMNSVRKSAECVNMFDMFSVENRMGRWAAQENLIYAMIGQHYLNIFNSRSIIYPWTLVSRKDRKTSNIHLELIRIKYPSLLDVPFEGIRSTFEGIAKMNGFTYYFASFVKYYIQKFQFKRRDDF